MKHEKSEQPLTPKPSAPPTYRIFNREWQDDIWCPLPCPEADRPGYHIIKQPGGEKSTVVNTHSTLKAASVEFKCLIQSIRMPTCPECNDTGYVAEMPPLVNGVYFAVLALCDCAYGDLIIAVEAEDNLRTHQGVTYDHESLQ